MKFSDALKTGLPIRRKEWNRDKGRRISYEPVLGRQWIMLGEVQTGIGGRTRYPWLVVSTGVEVTLQVDDYIAEDWETLGQVAS